jgi:hypothetical protein
LPKKVQDLIRGGVVSGLTAVELSKKIADESELIANLEQAIESAPASLFGEKKKLTKRSISQIATISPIKKLIKVGQTLKEEGVDEKYSSLIELLVTMLKDKNTSVETIVNNIKSLHS